MNITIGFTPNALTEIVPRAMREIKELLPSVDIKLVEGSSDEQIGGLLKGDVDIAFIPEPRSEVRGLEVREIDRSTHVAVVPEDSPLARKKELELRDLEGEVLILPPERSRPEYRAALVQAFRNARVPFKVGQEALFDHARLRMVAAGLGVTFVSVLAAPRGHPGAAIRRVRDLPDNVSMAQCMLWRSAVSPSARKIFEAACRSVDRRHLRSRPQPT
jgi:DNA-binding transcriptional LysR family regulator